QLVKVLGAETAGPPGSYEKGLGAERAFLAREVGLDTLSIRLADGSGVSRYNLVTARQIVRLLAYMANRDDLAAVYAAALPIAGLDGTLEDRMAGTPAEGHARAKTGSLSGVSALSGYAPAADGERLAFSIVMEFFAGPTTPVRAVQDSLVVELTKFRR
ncbi:MAG: D-alanyl-D-alanine carboxypeptidase/D-alanyl-D-alanine-endopeptidase, partial [Gemmatimonadetes bacterium]|nr:D-alanyl-D-alanine carboxypeptidase/D-alanyl-D-alanine-endopeptidase [Gemmatimonadota bacterium]